MSINILKLKEAVPLEGRWEVVQITATDQSRSRKEDREWHVWQVVETTEGLIVADNIFGESEAYAIASIPDMVKEIESLRASASPKEESHV